MPYDQLEFTTGSYNLKFYVALYDFSIEDFLTNPIMWPLP